MAEYEKAPLGKRFLAALVDLLIVLVLQFIPIVGNIIGIVYFFVRDAIEYQTYFDGRSIGKKVLGLRVVNTETGKKPNYVEAFLRQLTMAIPVLNVIECVLVILDEKGLRLGDKLAKTQVIAE